MSILRLLWRLTLLLLHTLHGAWISWQARHSAQQSPDPQIISDWSHKLLRIMGVELEIFGKAPHEPAMIVANHISWLDIPVISACTHAAFLAKDPIRRWPVIGWFAVSSGTVFIRRGKGEAEQVAAVMAERLQNDRQLAIFPEGRITAADRVERFFPRLFAAAIEAQVPVAPVALRYRLEDGSIDEAVTYLPGRSLMSILFKVLVRRKTWASIIFCPLIPVAGKDRRSLAEASRAAIISALREPLHKSG